MFTIVLFCSIVCVGVFMLWQHCKKLSSSSVPRVPNIMGTIWTITTSNLSDIFKELVTLGEFTNDNGGVSKIDVGPLVFYVVSSPEDTSRVLNQAVEKNFLYDLIKPYVGSQLVAASATTWKRNKRVVDLSMKQNVLDQYNFIFNEYSRRLVEVLAVEVNKEMDFSDIITRSVLEMVSQTTMGMSLDGDNLITDRYADAVTKELEVLIGRARSPWLLLDVFFNWSSLKKVQDDALDVIFSLSDKMVQIRKEEHLRRLKNNDFNDDDNVNSFLEIIIKNTVSEDSELFTDIELRNLVDNIMLAGFDTSSTEIIYALLCVGHHTHVQRRLHDELQRVIRPRGRAVTKNDLAELTYLDAVVKETLRLYPIGPVVARYSTKDIKLENHVIPAGCQIILHIWSLNRNKIHWGPDAEEFKPERWLHPSTLPSHPSAFGTFLFGRRFCIGKSYAMTMMKIILAHIIQEYKVTADLSKLELEMVVLLKANAGHCFKLERRN